jgi:hypothetical protein
VADLTTVFTPCAVCAIIELFAAGPDESSAGHEVRWQFTAEGHQSFLRKKPVDGKPNDRHIEAVLDELLLQPPRRRASTSDPIPASPGTARAVAPASQPYQPSPVIAAMDWAPTNNMVRRATATTGL